MELNSKKFVNSFLVILKSSYFFERSPHLIKKWEAEHLSISPNFQAVDNIGGNTTCKSNEDQRPNVQVEDSGSGRLGPRKKPGSCVIGIGSGDALRRPSRAEAPIFPRSTAELSRRERVRSGIHMSAKDRLDSLMLARRSASDLSMMKPVSIDEIAEDGAERIVGICGTEGGLEW